MESQARMHTQGEAADQDARPRPVAVGAYVARVRRLADLSQRELARRVDVAPSTVGRWETDQLPMRVAEFETVLALADLHLVVADAGGTVVPPFAPDVVRDNADRRFPAHLDVVPPDQRPSNRGVGERYDRPPARAWYSLRRLRDDPDRREEIARNFGESQKDIAAPPVERPADHPTLTDLALRRAELRQARERLRPPRAPMGEPWLDCTCADDCYLEARCLDSCACQCESRFSS